MTVSQPMDEVEDALIDFIQHNILTGAVLDNVFAEIRREIETQPSPGRARAGAAMSGEQSDVERRPPRVQMLDVMEDAVGSLASR